jgi:hypothetical protein
MSSFWALFGLAQKTDVYLQPFSNPVTEYFGGFLYGSYHLTSIIVMLNMLVASMTQSFERILVNFFVFVIVFHIILFISSDLTNYDITNTFTQTAPKYLYS